MSEVSGEKGHSDKQHVWDNPRNVTFLLWALVVVCVAVAAADLFYVKKIHFEPERVFAAYGIYGFVCFVFIVFAGKLLRKFVMRDEDYYD